MLERDKFLGCLIAGAAGDALGAPTEFMAPYEIVAKYGDGIKDMDEAYGRVGAITDDTQMTLFTAEAMLEHLQTGKHAEVCLTQSYLYWLMTQDDKFVPERYYGGRLMGIPELWSRRAPGTTCLSALRSIAKTGVAENNSKGCGGVMRTAPIGLVFEPKRAFLMGRAAASITHKHPDGYNPAGCLSMLVSLLIRQPNIPLREHVSAVLDVVKKEAPESHTVVCLEKALSLSHNDDEWFDYKNIVAIGEGWTGDEAFGIGVYAALATDSLEKSIVMAANHGGDTDSTAAIAGNIAGARDGIGAVPERWLRELELKNILEEISEELYNTLHRAV